MWDNTGNRNIGKPIPFSIQATAEEIAAMNPDERREYDDLQRRIVFGHDSKVDKAGRPIEQGIGSEGNQSLNHFQAILKFEGRGAFDRATKTYIEHIRKREGAEAAERARASLISLGVTP
jgi:hypothetical protein